MSPNQSTDSETDQKTVFKVKFGLGEGASPTITAINRAVALTSRCANCTAIAIGFQVVTTTEQDLVDLHAINVAKATNNDCTATCDAVADVYQVVVATDTPQPMSFVKLLSPQQRNALYQLRSEFLALAEFRPQPDPGSRPSARTWRARPWTSCRTPTPEGRSPEPRSTPPRRCHVLACLRMASGHTPS